MFDDGDMILIKIIYIIIILLFPFIIVIIPVIAIIILFHAVDYYFFFYPFRLTIIGAQLTNKSNRKSVASRSAPL